MSAYVVSREHIEYLVSAGTAWQHISHGAMSWWWGNPGRHDTLDGYDHKNASRVGQLLWDENIRSVQGRYPDSRNDESRMPGPVGENFLYDHVPWPGSIEPVEVFKACACYCYQSCEHEEWEASEAFAYIQALRKQTENALPGYDEAEWGPPDKPERVGILLVRRGR